MKKNSLKNFFQKNKGIILRYLKKIAFFVAIILFFDIISRFVFIPPQLSVIRYFLLLSLFWAIFIFLLHFIFAKPSFHQTLFRIEIIGYSVFLSLFLVSSELTYFYFFIFSFLILTTTYEFCPFGPYFISTIGSLTILINFLLHSEWTFHHLLLVFSQIFALYFWAHFSRRVVDLLRKAQEEEQRIERLYKKIEKNYEELQALDKAKDTFLEIASHQIRTPLSLIEGTLSMILKAPSKIKNEDFQENLIKKAYEGVQRLQTLSKNLLSISAIEAEKIKLNLEKVKIDKLAKEVYEIFKTKAELKKIDFKFEKKGQFSAILADAEKLKEVMEIFVDNAFKYTLKGFIKIRVVQEKDGYVFEVEDSGVGIPKDIQEKLFQKFVRADNVKAISPEGVGLGLYIAQRLIKLHKGKVYFKSEEGKGSTFGFKIPFTVKE